MKITKVADGAYFVPSYSEQTIVRAYSTDTTLQSFGYVVDADAEQPSQGHVQSTDQLPPAFVAAQ